MTYDGTCQCPACGSGEAVAKSTAWDALAEVPTRVQEELERLRSIQAIGRNVVQFGPHTGGDGTEVITVRADLLDELAAAVGRDLRS